MTPEERAHRIDYLRFVNGVSHTAPKDSRVRYPRHGRPKDWPTRLSIIVEDFYFTEEWARKQTRHPRLQHPLLLSEIP